MTNNNPAELNRISPNRDDLATHRSARL